MKPSKEWKSSESRIAEKFGGRRVPITGRQRGDAPDVEHHIFAIEHKYGKRIISSRVNEALEQADASAEKNGRFPIVTVEQTDGKRGSKNKEVVIIKTDVFLEIIKDMM